MGNTLTHTLEIAMDKRDILLNWSEEKLSTGQHKTPPKGYPTNREDYAVPEFWMFPIDNEERVEAAIKLYGKHNWKEEEHPKEAAKRILSRAKKYGITVGKDSEVWKAAHS